MVIVERGWAAPNEMIGSWAGAMGHTQWMPEVWLNMGVDFNGDGRISPFGPPDDALAGTAQYLAKRGHYRRGEGWGYEVQLPPGMHPAGGMRSIASWREQGVRRANGKPFPETRRAGAPLAARARRSRVPADAQFRRHQILQSGQRLRAGYCASRRPPSRRRAVRSEFSRCGGAAADARRGTGNAAPPHRARLRHRRHGRPRRQGHHARNQELPAQGRDEAGGWLCRAQAVGAASRNVVTSRLSKFC